MFGSQVLETIIGLSFIYLVLSVFASSLGEWVASLFSLRARTLETSLKNLLAEDTGTMAERAAAAAAASNSTDAVTTSVAKTLGARLATDILGHPLVQNTSAPNFWGTKAAKPSYLDAKVFSSALLDIVIPAGSQHSFAELRSSIQGLQNEELKRTLLPIVDRASGDIDRARAGIETWYDQAMDRLTGLYKRRSQVIIFVIGFVLAVVVNANTFRVVRHLWRERPVREYLAQNTKDYKPNSQETDPKKKLEQASSEIAAIYEQKSSPLGWTEVNSTEAAVWYVSLLGWLLTAVAVSFGAPFWFDFLNKTLGLNARLTGAKPKPAQSEAK